MSKLQGYNFTNRMRKRSEIDNDYSRIRETPDKNVSYLTREEVYNPVSDENITISEETKALIQGSGRVYNMYKSREMNNMKVQDFMYLSEYKLHEYFCYFDNDGSGELDHEEMHKLGKALGISKDLMELIIHEIDYDSDGTITFEEWMEYIRKCKTGEPTGRGGGNKNEVNIMQDLVDRKNNKSRFKYNLNLQDSKKLNELEIEDAMEIAKKKDKVYRLESAHNYKDFYEDVQSEVNEYLKEIKDLNIDSIKDKKRLDEIKKRTNQLNLVKKSLKGISLKKKSLATNSLAKNSLAKNSLAKSSMAKTSLGKFSLAKASLSREYLTKSIGIGKSVDSSMNKKKMPIKSMFTVKEEKNLVHSEDSEASDSDEEYAEEFKKDEKHPARIKRRMSYLDHVTEEAEEDELMEDQIIKEIENLEKFFESKEDTEYKPYKAKKISVFKKSLAKETISAYLGNVDTSNDKDLSIMINSKIQPISTPKPKRRDSLRRQEVNGDFFDLSSYNISHHNRAANRAVSLPRGRVNTHRKPVGVFATLAKNMFENQVKDYKK